jgi:hypothetical protein
MSGAGCRALFTAHLLGEKIETGRVAPGSSEALDEAKFDWVIIDLD